MEKLGRDVCNNTCRSTLAAILLHFLSNVTAQLATAGFACVIFSSHSLFGFNARTNVGRER